MASDPIPTSTAPTLGHRAAGSDRRPKESTVATRTRTSNRAGSVTAPVFKSKSDAARALYDEGKTVTEVASKLGIGYAFAYGIASRHGVAKTAAARKPVKRVAVNADGSITVQTTAGAITVNPDGTVIRPKAARAPKA